MTADWQQIDAVLDRLYAADREEREAMLEEMEATDSDLAREARRLLASADSDLVDPAGALATGVLAGIVAGGPEPPASHPERIGPWSIVRELGRGGMGVVYLAERTEEDFEQRVALKLLPAGPQSEHLLRRFEQERRILAGLDHPGIARLIDGGVTDDGAPWFAMEYVEGEKIDDYCNRLRLSIDQRLKLFTEVAEAVQAAHRSLVVHRDLKPGNILVTEEGVVKLLDFGIAKPLEESGMAADATQTLQRVLTPEYSTPEQIRGGAITTGSDVYQLGLLLHELLTGRRAHQLTDTTPQGVERAVCEDPPTRPSVAAARPAESATSEVEDLETLAAVRGTTPKRLERRLRGDLDNIVLTALRKEPERRYASVEQMADDVRRHLQALPVRARSDTMAYRASRFVRRHAVGVAATAAALILVSTLVAFYTVRLQQERDRAQAEAAKAEQVAEFLAEIFRSSDPRQSAGDEPTVRAALDRGAERIGTDLAEQPVVQAELMNVLGRIYLEMGDFERAQELMVRGLELRRGHADTVEVAESLRSLAMLRYEQADYERSEELYLEVIQRLETTLGPDAPELAPPLNNLGLLYGRTAAYDQAIAAYERARRIFEADPASDPVDLGKVANNLGNIHFAMGENSSARAEYEHALAIHESALEADNPLLAGTLANIGLVRLRLEEYEGVEEIFRRELAIVRKSYGSVNTNVAHAFTHLASLFSATDRFQEAVDSYHQAGEIYRQALGEDHPYVAFPLYKLGGLYLSENRPVEAADYFRKAVNLREATLGPEHPRLANALEGLGRALTDVEEFSEAEAVLRRTVAIRRLSQHDDPISLGDSLHYLGGALVAQQRCAEALPLLQEAKGIFEADEEAAGEMLAEVTGLLATCTPAPRSRARLSTDPSLGVG